MHFRISKNAQSFFSDIINLEGSHGADDKNKFIQFDVYYCCALIGMAAGQLDEDTSDLKDLVDRYPKPCLLQQRAAVRQNYIILDQLFRYRLPARLIPRYVLTILVL